VGTLLGVEVVARGQRHPAQVRDAADVAGLVEPAPPERRRRARVAGERADALVLECGELVAREAAQGLVVDAVVGERHGDPAAAARAPMPKTRSALRA
jgi:hypothetical protein